MEGQVPAELKAVFGEEVLGHTMVLLTCGDYLMGLEEEVSEDLLQQLSCPCFLSSEWFHKFISILALS